ncbi:MAG TPA: glycosyltransferase family 2 protein [Gemmatimonadaceae bacterium]
MTVPIAIALAATIPWVLAPIVLVLRARRSRWLDEWPDVVPAPIPLVSVVIPARNEAHNIERCVRSVLACSHPRLEVIVVDDHSTDATGDLARAIAQCDPRLTVIVPPALPDGWFGKQWACAAGAAIAHGEILLFTDADTDHAPDLVPRAVNAMRERGAELFTVGGGQELATFWERVVQPQLFAILVARYGGTERMSNATKPSEVIANGQCIFIRRDAYDASGGHEAVRDKVAEDLALAQRFARQGRRIGAVAGIDQLSTRMYTSLSEIVRGWQKNIYAGGREAVPYGAFGRALFPCVLIAVPMFELAPPLVLVAGIVGVAPPVAMIWALVCVASAVLFWVAFYRFVRLPVGYALLYPLGLLVLLYIVVSALARGRRVEWKDRAYRVT